MGQLGPLGIPLRALDHLMFRLPRPRLPRVVRLDGAYGSDHYPLVGWVE